MASPPFDIAHTTPQDNDIISQFPGTERTFRDIVESWLNILSDPTTGLLKSTAIVVPLTLTTATTGNPMLTLESTEAGAGSGPAIELYRNSASPAASDVLGVLYWYGEDSAGNKQEYAALFPSIVDATSASEDGTMQLRITVAGTPTTRVTANAAGVILSGALSGPTSIASTGDISGTTGTFSSSMRGANSSGVASNGSFEVANGEIAHLTSGTLLLRPNGIGSAVGQLTVAATGNVSAAGTFTATGAISSSAGLSGTTGSFSGAVSGTTGTFSSFVSADAYTAAPGAGGLGFRVNGGGVNVGPSYVAVYDADGSQRLGYFGAGGASTAINFLADLGNIAISATAGDITLTAGGGNITLANATSVTGTLTATLFSGSGASLTTLNASELDSGTVPSARVTGSYTGITGTGALNAGTITSGFGTISTGDTISGTAISGTTGTFSSTLTAASTVASTVGIFEGGDTTCVLGATGAGTVYLRPNGVGSAVGQATVNSAGRLDVADDIVAVGSIVTTVNGIHTNNKFAANPATAGCSLTASGQAVFAINDVFLIGNRLSSDGSLVHLRQANVTDGTISTAAGVVTYGTFFGAHWSQLKNDNSRPPILRGTICEHIDEVCHWDDNPYPEPLPKFKVSDTYGTTRPYGVFSTWDLDDDSGDAYIGGLGTFFIRIDATETVQGGDWIMSAGNGCGVVMDPMDDPRKHVATVTAAVVSETYPDGSYLVPCTLHCG